MGLADIGADALAPGVQGCRLRPAGVWTFVFLFSFASFAVKDFFDVFPSFTFAVK